MYSINSYCIYCTCQGQSYKHLFSQTHPHTFPLLHPAVCFHLLYISVLLSLTNKLHIISNTCNHLNTPKRWQLHPATFYIDVNGGFLLGALLQADVAAHVNRLSPGDVQCGHPIDLFLPPHLWPVLSLPLHRLLTLATQLEGCVEWDDNVGIGGGDSRLGVAYNGIEEEINCISNIPKSW